jgi:hypothetical protein
MVRLHFRRPVPQRRIRLVFEEETEKRTQEFVLSYRANAGARDAEIVRQQFTFSPVGAITEREDYDVDLRDVIALELSVVPHIGGGASRATLKQLCVAYCLVLR